MISLSIDKTLEKEKAGLADVLRLFFGTLQSLEPLTAHYTKDVQWTLHSSDEHLFIEGTDYSSVNTQILLRSLFQHDDLARAFFQKKREAKRLLYLACSSLTQCYFPWGALTGIRPSLIAYECMKWQLQDLSYIPRTISSEENEEFMIRKSSFDEVGEEKNTVQKLSKGEIFSAMKALGLKAFLDRNSLAYRLLKEYYCLSEQKIHLVLQTAYEEQKIACTLKENGTSVYVGIPFCPSRCTYCSFSATDGIQRKDAVISTYLDLLLEELQSVTEKFRPEIECLYIGGGTPTSLYAEQLDRLLDTLQQCFPHVQEITLEAGRPDTMQKEKLLVAKRRGVQRICINPQSFQQETLLRVHRFHAVDDIYRVYEEARNLGFEDINMDLIAGLPLETLAMFRENLKIIERLKPDSFTVHALSLKRSSGLMQAKRAGLDLGIESARRSSPMLNQMQEEAYTLAQSMGMVPYYMYRQKDGVGGLENVAYAKPGRGCRYNVAMMSDQSSILAFGVGGMSKKKQGSRIERFAGFKTVDEYFKRSREQAEKKRNFFLKLG